MNVIEELNTKLDGQTAELDTLDRYWHGQQPSAYLSPESRAALGNRLRTVSVNFPRLACESLAERLEVVGFQFEDGDKPDADLWRVWQRCGMLDQSHQGHLDALVYGRSFVIVWTDANGDPLITVESPRQVAVLRDPATRVVTAAFKRWQDGNKAYGVLYQADKITRLSAPGNASAGVFPVTGWTSTAVIPNPLGVVPVVPIVNRGRLTDFDGVSEMDDLLDLADLLNKLTSDMAVTSEFYARPRRWATGLEIAEDDDGNVLAPFSAELDALWQSESPDTKFGQFSATGLSGYIESLAFCTQSIGALAKLPPHYLGLNGDQPPSADSIRAAEASMVSRCLTLHRTFGGGWRQVAQLIRAVKTGCDPQTVDVTVLWADPSTRTPAQSADAAAKLTGIGIPLSIVAKDTLGWTPEQILNMQNAMRTEADIKMDPLMKSFSLPPVALPPREEYVK